MSTQHQLILVMCRSTCNFNSMTVPRLIAKWINDSIPRHTHHYWIHVDVLYPIPLYVRLTPTVTQKMWAPLARQCMHRSQLARQAPVSRDGEQRHWQINNVQITYVVFSGWCHSFVEDVCSKFHIMVRKNMSKKKHRTPFPKISLNWAQAVWENNLFSYFWSNEQLTVRCHNNLDPYRIGISESWFRSTCDAICQKCIVYL